MKSEGGETVFTHGEEHDLAARTIPSYSLTGLRVNKAMRSLYIIRCTSQVGMQTQYRKYALMAWDNFSTIENGALADFPSCGPIHSNLPYFNSFTCSMVPDFFFNLI
jgi:hypothetical protein